MKKRKLRKEVRALRREVEELRAMVETPRPIPIDQLSKDVQREVIRRLARGPSSLVGGPSVRRPR